MGTRNFNINGRSDCGSCPHIYFLGRNAQGENIVGCMAHGSCTAYFYQNQPDETNGHKDISHSSTVFAR